VASVSEHLANEDIHGRLSMWRAFGNLTGPRAAIVIRIPQHSDGALKLHLIFSPVAYLTENEAHDVVRSVIQNITLNHDYLKSLDRQMVRRLQYAFGRRRLPEA
jgi:hypothetical protein